MSSEAKFSLSIRFFLFLTWRRKRKTSQRSSICIHSALNSACSALLTAEWEDCRWSLARVFPSLAKSPIKIGLGTIFLRKWVMRAQIRNKVEPRSSSWRAQLLRILLSSPRYPLFGGESASIWRPSGQNGRTRTQKGGYRAFFCEKWHLAMIF